MMGMHVVAGAFVLAALASVGVAARPAGAARQESRMTTTAQSPINLNAATEADLEKLPGIGPAMAKRIVDYRQKSGGFKKVEELMNVSGIGEKNFLKLKPLVTVSPVRTAER